MRSNRDKWIFWVLLVLVAALSLPFSLAFSLTSGVSFTINGYDVDDGVDPICWHNSWWPQKEYVDLQNFKMRPKCYAGTSVKITPLDLELDESIQVMHTDHAYSFKIEASVDYNEIARWFRFELDNFIGSMNVGPLRTSYCLLRVVLCDTSKIGFCNPLAVGLPLDSEEAGNDYAQPPKDTWYGNVSSGVLRGVKIGNHIFSPWLNLTMEEVSPNNFTMSTTIKMKLPENERGTFFTIGHAHYSAHMLPENRTDEFVELLEYIYNQLQAANAPPPADEGPQVATIGATDVEVSNADNNPYNATEGAFLLVETAAAVPNNVIEVRKPPKIHSVSKAMKIGVGIASGICSLCALATFVFIVVNREHAVMKLAQWQFMAWLALSCLVLNATVFTYMPTKDWHCRWSNILQFIPLTMIGTVLVGRGWRIYVTISAASAIGIRRKSETDPTMSDKIRRYCVGMLSYIAAFPYNVLEKDKDAASHRNSGFRQKITVWQTCRLIAWLTLPQVIMQILGIIFVDSRVEIDFDKMMAAGREVCEESGQWVRRAGIVLSAAAYATAVLLAWVSRELPSAFNETDSIFQAATINTIVGLLAISLDQVITSSQTPPDVNVFLWTATALIESWVAVGFIILPKIKRVLSGEEFVISNVLRQGKLSAATTSTHDNPNSGQIASTPSSTRTGAPIHLKRNEAIPRKLEQNMLGVSKLLGGCRHELAEGRIPKLREWEQLISKVDELHNEFERIEFDWTEDDERG